jgi:hypothetical protein
MAKSKPSSRSVSAAPSTTSSRRRLSSGNSLTPSSTVDSVHTAPEFNEENELTAEGLELDRELAELAQEQAEAQDEAGLPSEEQSNQQSALDEDLPAFLVQKRSGPFTVGDCMEKGRDD